MPRIIIDNQEIDVPAGTKVIQAAESLGIMIPRFCYHPALGAVGACRVCAVRFLEGPVKGVQMSCMVAAADGMVVSTTHEEAVDFRRHVVELLMMNHPHDCPVCDEGGHCLLQDMTVSGGHGKRRYPGRKRTYTDQYLGPLIQQEMNRCIHCYRCARYYRELTGYSDLGVLRIGNRISYGRFGDGTLESPFAGNLVDICPTGVFTDKPSRYKGRRWDFERSPGICIHCSLGCHTTVSTRYREIVRQEARYNRLINDHFICDRGRYGFYYANLESRPREATVEGQPVSWNQACKGVSERLKTIERQAGSDAIACLGSVRSSVETHAMMMRMCRTKQWKDPVFFMDSALAFKVRSAISGLSPGVALPLSRVGEADMILVVGGDPVNEAPMLALELRKARRRGTAVVVLDPRPVTLPFDFQHIPVAPHDLDLYLGWLVKETIPRDTVAIGGPAAMAWYDAATASGLPDLSHEAEMHAAAEKLRSSRRPVIVCGTGAVARTTPGLAADFARLLNAMYPAAGLFYLMPGANAYSAGLFPLDHGGGDNILAGIEAGRIRALIVVETDPFQQVNDPIRLEKALDRLDLLVVLDYTRSNVSEKAHILMPTETLYEAGGVFINQEGRAQAVVPSCSGGVPISHRGGGHPPRIYGGGKGDCLPAWLSLACLADRSRHPEGMSVREDLLQWLVGNVPAFEDLPPIQGFPEDGSRLIKDSDTSSQFSSPPPSLNTKGEAGDNALTLIPVDWIFGTEELSVLAPCLREREAEPCIFMHERDARRLLLTDGDRVAVQLENGNVYGLLRVEDNMASGVLIIPRHRQLAGGPMGGGTVSLPCGRITKVAP